MLVSGLLEVICWVLAVFMLFLLAQISIKQSCYQFVSLNWPSQPLMVYCLLVSPQNLDTKLEDTENLLALIHIVVVPSWRGSKRGVAGGGTTCKTTVTYYLLLSSVKCIISHLFGLRHTKILSFQVMPAINTALSLHSISLIC